MARPIYAHEVTDPDFQWLLNSYAETNPHTALVDQSCLPIVLVLIDKNSQAQTLQEMFTPLALPAPEEAVDDSEAIDEKA